MIRCFLLEHGHQADHGVCNDGQGLIAGRFMQARIICLVLPLAIGRAQSARPFAD